MTRAVLRFGRGGVSSPPLLAENVKEHKSLLLGIGFIFGTSFKHDLTGESSDRRTFWVFSGEKNSSGTTTDVQESRAGKSQNLPGFLVLFFHFDPRCHNCNLEKHTHNYFISRTKQTGRQHMAHFFILLAELMAICNCILIC